MKKVRLFAVAAAMGMFAATVNAAAPKVTKEAYSATWGTMEEIVRAEIGGKVVLPSANVTVTKQTRTTENPSKGLLNATCYVGLTDNIGKDTNNDGLVDYPVLSWGAESGSDNASSIDAKVNPNWYYDELKFFPTVNTSLFYLGMTGNGLGARFIAPNAAAEKGWIISSTHVKYATEAEVLAALVEQGKIELVEDKHGDVVEIKYNKSVIKNSDKVTLGTVWTSFKAEDTRYGVDELAEDVVALFDGTISTARAASLAARTTKHVSVAAAADKTPISYYYTPATGSDVLVAPGSILVVEENRYGELVPVSASTATVGDIAPVADKIVVVLKEGTTTPKYSKYVTITPKTVDKGANVYSLLWDEETGIFEASDVAAAVYDETTHAAIKTAMGTTDYFTVSPRSSAKGLYKYNNPKNTTDQIVINFDLGVYGWSLDISGINTTKQTMTFNDAFGNELTTNAVKLDGKWYPTVANNAELQEFVRRMAGLRTASQSFVNELKAKKVYSTITWLDGTKDTEYVPANPLAHYKAQQCTYLTEETAVDAASVVVTNNAASIDTNQYGVHNVTLTAKVGETVVGTKDVKVVIAPKYVREYKNGKVTSLKAYHLNGNLYSHTTFDYAGKKSTAVFYAQDGVTAVETQTSDIK